MDAEERLNLEKLLAIHLENLRKLEEQQALLGLPTPLEILNKIQYEKEKIETIKKQLAQGWIHKDPTLTHSLLEFHKFDMDDILHVCMERLIASNSGSLIVFILRSTNYKLINSLSRRLIEVHRPFVDQNIEQIPLSIKNSQFQLNRLHHFSELTKRANVLRSFTIEDRMAHNNLLEVIPSLLVDSFLHRLILVIGDKFPLQRNYQSIQLLKPPTAKYTLGVMLVNQLMDTLGRNGNLPLGLENCWRELIKLEYRHQDEIGTEEIYEHIEYIKQHWPQMSRDIELFYSKLQERRRTFPQ